MATNDFALETKLKQLDENLFKLYSSAGFSMRFVLKQYQQLFPTFTDHTIVHSMDVIDFCNQLIGKEIEKMNVDEIYIIIMSCYLHDAGMGISQEDFIELSPKIDFGDYFETHERSDVASTVRNFHNEFSGLIVDKYWKFFEIPSDEYRYAIKQVCRGHRKTNLEDRNEYPVDFKVPNGNTVCLPFLSAILRLADEIDITDGRNALVQYDLNELEKEVDIVEFMKHEAVKDLVVTEKELIMKISTDDETVFNNLKKVASKIQHTLDGCRKAVNGVTNFEITQEKVVVERI